MDLVTEASRHFSDPYLAISCSPKLDLIYTSFVQAIAAPRHHDIVFSVHRGIGEWRVVLTISMKAVWFALACVELWEIFSMLFHWFYHWSAHILSYGCWNRIICRNSCGVLRIFYWPNASDCITYLRISWSCCIGITTANVLYRSQFRYGTVCVLRWGRHLFGNVSVMDP